MEFELLGWPSAGPTLSLDHERFAYAGKFVMSSTGKAVAREDDEILAAVAFNADRTDDGVCWLRYVTVRVDRRGEGIGPRLCAFVRDRALDRGFEAVRIAVNNPFAFEALHRAGFGYTGETTGIAELVLSYPPADDRAERYREGFGRFREREFSEAEKTFLEDRRGSDPPDAVR